VLILGIIAVDGLPGSRDAEVAYEVIVTAFRQTKPGRWHRLVEG
jgi:hypothetical protein